MFASPPRSSATQQQGVHVWLPDVIYTRPAILSTPPNVSGAHLRSCALSCCIPFARYPLKTICTGRLPAGAHTMASSRVHSPLPAFTAACMLDHAAAEQQRHSSGKVASRISTRRRPAPARLASQRLLRCRQSLCKASNGFPTDQAQPLPPLHSCRFCSCCIQRPLLGMAAALPHHRRSRSITETVRRPMAASTKTQCCCRRRRCRRRSSSSAAARNRLLGSQRVLAAHPTRHRSSRTTAACTLLTVAHSSLAASAAPSVCPHSHLRRRQQNCSAAVAEPTCWQTD